MNQSTSNSSMPKSTAEALKQIQKQGLSISIISGDNSKTFPLETASKDTRTKQNAVSLEKLLPRSTVSTESKPSVTQSRQTSTSVETRPCAQPAISANQVVQPGNANKTNPLTSAITENKQLTPQRLGSSNAVENKNQAVLNRMSQIEKNPSNLGRLSQNLSFIENKVQNNRNSQNVSSLMENKTPVRINQAESKNQVVNPRTQNQSLMSESKMHSNQNKLSVSSPPLDGKTLSNQGRPSQNCSTPMLDKNVSGQRNQLQMSSEIKTSNFQSKIIPIGQIDAKTLSSSKGHQNVKLISGPRIISQYHPNVSRPSSNVNNNGKLIADKSCLITSTERSINNPFRVACTKNSPEENPIFKVTRLAQNVSDNQSVQSKIAQHISMKTENKAISKVIKISEMSSDLHKKTVPFDNSSEVNSPRLNTMPLQKSAVKRIAITTSTPNTTLKRKCIKVVSPTVLEQSANKSDISNLSSDESPIKEKKVYNLKTLTPGLTITPIHSSTHMPSTSGCNKKVGESNPNLIIICPECEQVSHNLSSCDTCQSSFSSSTVRYQIKNTQQDSASYLITQNVTTSIEKKMQIFYEFPSMSGQNRSFQYQQSQQVIRKVSPRKAGRPRRKFQEPVCYTLSSDDEEAVPFGSMLEDMIESEGSKSEHSSNSDMMQEENQEFDELHYPGVTCINNQQIDEEDEEDLEHEMESENELMEEEEEGEHHEYGDDEEVEEEEDEDEADEEIPPDEDEGPVIDNKFNLLTPVKIILYCRSIRIGSFKIHPDQNSKSLMVHLTKDGITFPAYRYTDSKNFVKITLKASETENTWIHFGKCLPIIFAFTSRNFGDAIRKHLNMSEGDTVLFDPKSDDVRKNKLTFLIDTLNEDQRTFMRNVFPGPEKLKEIDQKEANEMLVKSTPQSLVKIASPDSHMNAVIGPLSQSLSSLIPPNLSTQSLSITKVLVKPAPPVPVTKILTYPPPPQTGGIAINTADLATLEEGEFLNDAILDFYLKYVFYEKLSLHDREKTHLFSSFFYPRLTQKVTQKTDRQRIGDDELKTTQMRRHSQVKTWTKNVDIFSKDYIIIPVNQSNHWFLALICYPGHVIDAPKVECKVNKCVDNVTSTNDQESSKVIIKEEICNSEDVQNPDENSSSNSLYEVEEPPDSDEASSEVPDSSTHPDGYIPYSEGNHQRKETPCILIFDSLSGPNRWRIAAALRDYLEVEWKIRKGSRKVFDRNTMQGFILKCPQQTNFSDCGLYVLQYVESFFENPIPYFANPMPDLTNWFSDVKISKKRQQLKGLILSLQKKYQVKQVGTIKKTTNQTSVSSPGGSAPPLSDSR